MYIDSGAERGGKLVRVQLHIGLEYVGGIGGQGRGHAGSQAAAEVHHARCTRAARLQPLCTTTLHVSM